MATEQKPRTAEINARLWGVRATDWAEIQEGTCRPVYLAVFEQAGLKPGTPYLDAGCGAGMAAQIAAERGAEVFGLDAAPNLVEIARARVPGPASFILEIWRASPFRRSLIWSPDLIHFNMPGILGSHSAKRNELLNPALMS